MENGHRQSIFQNILKLEEIQNFDEIKNKLVELKVYPSKMIQMLLDGNKNKKQTLFLDITNRGPSAFKNLVRALRATGNETEAENLIEDSSIPWRLKAEWIPFEDESSTDSNCSSSFSGPSLPLKKFKSSEPLLMDKTANGKNKCSNAIITTEKPQQPIGPISLENEVNESSSPNRQAATYYNGYPEEFCYKMKSYPRGYALIVNNIEFQGDLAATRKGAENDSNSLRLIFDQIGFEVTLEENVTKQGLLASNGILEKFVQKCGNSNADSCIVSINTHGLNRDTIRMSNAPNNNYSDKVDLFKEVIHKFNNRNFPEFYEKPKVFLFNACRGTELNRNVRTSPENKQTRFDGHVAETVQHDGSEFSDIFILRSTVPEYVSRRDEETGTWFVQCVCEAFRRYASTHHFRELVDKINDYMEEYIDYDGFKQSCVYEQYGKTKRLYFNPGL